VAEHIAECQRVLEKSGLKYKVHRDLTTLFLRRKSDPFSGPKLQ
jgi:hypothetical protein